MMLAQRGRVFVTGYLKPCVPELKIKDYQTYQAFCRGMFAQLAQDYGFFSHDILDTDCVLFALLCDSLAGREGTRSKKRSIYHGFRSQPVLSQTYGIRFACKVQLILTWHQLAAKKKHSASAFMRFRCGVVQVLLKNGYKKALQDEGVTIDRLLTQAREHSYALALAECTNYDVASEPFANMFSTLFMHCSADDASWKSLQQFGYHLGRICFFVQQVRQYDNDKQMGAYNIFVKNGLTKNVAIETAKRHCNQAAADLARATALMNLQINRSLLDNIIYLGLEETVEALGDDTTDGWSF